MSGVNFPSDSPSSKSEDSFKSSEPSNPEKSTDAVAGRRLSQSSFSRSSRAPSLESERVSPGTPVSSSRRIPLMEETPMHQALRAYDDVLIPKSSRIILTATVFDGVGDLEHLIHTVSCIQESFPCELVVILEKGASVPEEAWEAKLKVLSSLVQTIYCLGISPVRNQEVLQFTSELAKLKKKPCVMSISADPLNLQGVENTGYITEYGVMIEPVVSLDKLPAGFMKSTIGLWMGSDPVFRENSDELSKKTQNLVFGSVLSIQEKEKWDIGVASFRDDPARLQWIALRLSQVVEDKNCCLILSSFKDSFEAKKRILELAAEYGFKHCVLTDTQGKEDVLSGKEGLRALRIVHAFIDEADLPILIQKASQGSLGGAGDTSCVRGLLGKFPLVVDIRLYEPNQMVDCS